VVRFLLAVSMILTLASCASNELQTQSTAPTIGVDIQNAYVVDGRTVAIEFNSCGAEYRSSVDRRADSGQVEINVTMSDPGTTNECIDDIEVDLGDRVPTESIRLNQEPLSVYGGE